MTEPESAFWLNHSDPTQAAVHLALQWLAFVYPASELQIDQTLKHASPYADADLSSRWSQFLDENDVEDHVDALEWLADTLSVEQMPFLVETCWRLLLVDHEIPSHVPLALRILGQVINLSESSIYEIGEAVYREFLDADEQRNRAPLLPVDPRYLDRVEWRLYGHAATTRLKQSSKKNAQQRNLTGLYGFLWGAIFGAGLLAALVFGPLQLGRVKVPIMLHDGLLIEQADTQPVVVTTDVVDAQVAEQPVVAVATEVEQPLITEPLSILLDAAPSLEANNLETIELEAAAGNTASIDATAPESTAAETAFSERELMVVTASLLNVRAQPSVNSDIVIKLAAGAKVWAYPAEAEGLWMLIKVEGQVGYASARFLKPNSAE